MLRAVIFDMDGLLVDSEPLWRQAEIKVFHERINLQLSEAECAQTMGMRIDHVVRHWLALYPRPGVDPDVIAAAIVDRVVHLIASEGRALPGVQALLARLSRRSLKLAVASSSHLRLIRAVLERLGLTSTFQVVHSAELEASGKPDPAVYLSTARQLAVAPEDCLVFEDSVAGVQAARAANMQVIAVPAQDQREDPRYAQAHVIVDSLEVCDDAWLRHLDAEAFA